MALTYTKETFRDLMPELPELFWHHWDELYDDKELMPLDVDWLGYLHTEATGKLHILTARDGENLVGYAFIYAGNNKQSKGVTVAATEHFYLKPEYRKGTEGWIFLNKITEMARDLGAKKLYIVQKSKGSIAPLLKRKGFKPEEETFSCLL
ncbi:MAG: GNAT family N-acetyltransferase [Patescibacteria group bacterium]|nr:GNAT family N-acetyltransferase [Patescibacteria group bacterium]